MSTVKNTIRYIETTYGFGYGALDVTRIHSDTVKGYVLLQLKTPKSQLQVYVTKTGKIRIFNELENGREAIL